jgi:hypothetical protein
MAKASSPVEPRHAPAAAPASSRPTGRSLVDFGELAPAEQMLLDQCRKGEVAFIAGECPSEATDANRIRASLVRFLALGGDEAAGVHEHGVRLRGAWLVDALDLVAARIACPLELQDCRIERIDAQLTDLASLDLDGSRLEDGLWGDGLRCRGSIFMGEGFHATSGVRLSGATIGGDLSCARSRFENEGGQALSCDLAKISGGVYLRAGFHSVGAVVLLDTAIGGTLLCGGRLENETGPALVCDRATISGGVYFRPGFEATGEVRLPGASIGGNLECDGARFRNETGDALMCHRVRITGGIYLRHGFHATGEVGLLGAIIGGDLDCVASTFENPDGFALVCQSARVTGGFLFRSVDWIAGDLDLSSMHVTDLFDDTESWTCENGRVFLDGFTYSRFVGDAPTNAVQRIAWLRRQLESHLGEDFRPQPWEQLAAVLRATGHPDRAREVAVAKQTHLRRAGKIVRGARTLHWLYGAFVGYGYKPVRLLTGALAVWLVCGAVYWAAANTHWFGETRVIAPADQGRAGDRSVEGYDSFSPWVYSADVLLPVVDLGYSEKWMPVPTEPWGRGLRYLRWLEIVLGWLFGGVLVAMLGGLIKKD